MRRFIYGLVALVIAATGVALADSIITGSKPFTFTPGTVISSSQVNANFDYIINQVNTNAAKNGVNASITALTGLTTPINPTQGGSQLYTSGTVGGTANALTISTTTPAISSYSLSNRNLVTFIAAATNTASAPTLNVNGTGALVLFKTGAGTPGDATIGVRPGEIIAGGAYLVYYNGVGYVIINMPRLFGGAVNLAAAATTDLGTIGTHHVVITGSGVNITSFGNAADIDEPIYYVRFATGPVTVVNSANIVLPPNGGVMDFRSGDAFIAVFQGSGVWRIEQVVQAQFYQNAGYVNSFGATNNGGTPNTQIDFFGGSSLVTTPFGYPYSSAGFGGTINAAVVGANGIDTGALAANTWYYMWMIGNGNSIAGLLSLSSTAPTMPIGYSYRYRVGAVRTNGSSQLLRFIQRGNNTRYNVIGGSTTPNLPIIASGVAGNPAVPTWSNPSVSNFVPPTAVRIQGVISMSNSTSNIIAAPNASYGAAGSASNPTPAWLSVRGSTPFDFIIEGSTISWASADASGLIFVQGWTDAVNAN